jgi:enamine deaminase RidA (YjgF/YER057c/UK114 family)
MPVLFFAITVMFQACKVSDQGTSSRSAKKEQGQPEYFLLRPALENAFGYAHAVKIGKWVKISGAASMDEQGTLLGADNMEQQMKNCYADIETILKHYGLSFEHVVVENIFTTNLDELTRVSGYRNTLYKSKFPTGTWVEVKGLVLKGQLIEIEVEAYDHR